MSQVLERLAVSRCQRTPPSRLALGSEGFSAEWLALREPADARARDAGLTEQFAQARASGSLCGRRRASSTSRAERAPTCATSRRASAATSTGCSSTTTPRCSKRHEALRPTLRALLTTEPRLPARRVETRRLDLTTDLHALDFAPGVVVTASALLDLVSDEWLAQLVEQCRANRCAALFALSYDGRIGLTPSDPDDEWIRQLVNRHQLGDKGFGPALGPAALSSERASYSVRRAFTCARRAATGICCQQSARSSKSLLEGWAGAAAELAPNEADRCKRWLTRRLAHVVNGTSRIIVGHQDVLACAS